MTWLNKVVLAFTGCALVLSAGLSSLAQYPPPAGPTTKAADTTKPASGPAASGPAVPCASADQMIQSIPAGSTAFASMKSAQGLSDKLTGWMKELIPDAPVDEMAFANHIKDTLSGEGYSTEAPIVAVILDNAKYGTATQPASAPTTAAAEEGGTPSSEDPKAKDLPLAILIGGDKSMLPADQVHVKGDVITLGDGDDAWLAKEMKGFLILTPNARTLTAFGGAKSITAEFNEADKAILTKSDFAVWLSTKKAVEFFKSEIGKKLLSSGPFSYMFNPSTLMMFPPAMGGAYLGFTRSELFKAASSYTGGVNFAKTGLMIDIHANYPADSAYGKILAAYKPAEKLLITRIPKLPFIFAYGANKDTKMSQEMKAVQLKDLIDNEYTKDIPSDTRKKAQDAMLVIQEQVTAVQHYVGPRNENGDGVAFSTVAECKDAAKLMKAAADLASVAGEFPKVLKDLGGDQMELKYHANAEKVDELPVDAVNIKFQAMADMDEKAHNMLKSILGEDKVRLMIVQVDKNTVVTTLGGGPDFLKLAVKAAKEGKCEVEKDPNVVRSLSMLPKARGITALVGADTFWNTYMNMAIQVGGMPMAPVKVNGQAPLAGGVCFDKSGWTFNGYIPNEPIKAITAAVKQMMNNMMNNPPPPPPMQQEVE